MENQLIVPEKFEIEIQNASAVLADNQTRVKRAIDYGQSLLTNYQQTGVSDETYKAGIEYLLKVKKTVQVMNEKRKPITQLLNEIAKQFTSLEAELAQAGTTIPAQVKQKLDEYAAEVARKKRELELIAENKRRKEQQTTEFEAEIRNTMNQMYFRYLKDVIDRLERIWKEVKLEDFDSVTSDIVDAEFELPLEYFNVIKIERTYSALTQQDKDDVSEKIKTLLFPELKAKFEKEVDEAKHSIIVQFDERYTELQELAVADAEKAERIQKEADAREAKRIEEMNAKIKEDEKAAQEATENAKIAGNINSLFDSAQPVNDIKVKEVTEIHVTNPAGWIELVLFYFEREGKTLSPDKLEKKFGFAKKFAESAYMKSDEKITSKFLQYVETAKAK